MKKKSIHFIAWLLLLSVIILSHGQLATANDSDYNWKVNDDGTTVTITGYNGSDTIVVIPDKLDDKLVTGIGYAAFTSNELKSVILPNNLTSIGDWAFQNNYLTSIALPDSLTSIGSGAFHINYLTNIALPDSLTSIRGSAFSNNHLTSIALPDSLTSIGDRAFQNNQLTSVSLPDTLTSIGNQVFSGNKLTSLILPNKLTSIGSSAFQYNILTSVTVLSDSTIIGNEAFHNQGNSTTTTIYSHNSSTAENYAHNNNHSFKAFTYKIMYDGNNNTGGDVPVDSNEYGRQTAVTALDNTGQLVKTGYTFDGWNTLADGTGDDHAVNSTFQMGEADVTLYAKWTVNSPIVTDTEAPIWSADSDLSITGITTTSAQITWPLATDNTAIASYRIYVNGVEKVVLGNHEKSYVVTGLNDRTTYNFTVQAYDVAGNASISLGKTATTLSPVNQGGGGSDNSSSEPSYVPSSNNDLQELKVLLNEQLLTLTPDGSAFTLETKAPEIELFPTKAHSAAMVTLNGNTLVEGQKTPLHEGINIFDLTIEAENGTKKTYTIIIEHTLTEPVSPIEFNDMAGHWADDYIQQAAVLGILKGYRDGTFKPNQPLTRVQAVSIIVRALHLQNDEAAPFKDIGNYANETQAEIAAAYQFGIIKGNNGDFNPSNQITRAQIALMIQRAYEYKTGTKYDADKAPYSDFGNYNAETINAISMLHELGIATGSEGKFNPDNQTTRAQAAKMFVNLLNSLE